MKEKFLKNLTKWGYEYGKVFDASDFDKQRIDAIVGIVSERLVRRKTISKRYTSYKIKHLIEYQEEAVKGILGGYVSNGELIYAMILAGYDVCRDGDSKNAFFNVSTENVEKLELTKFKPYMMSKAFFRGRICDIDKENRCFVKINIHGEDGDYGY